MIVLGFLLLVAAALFGLDLAATNDHPLSSDVSVLGQSLGVHSDWVLFLVGAVTGAVALLGLSLITGGGGRGIRRRRMAKRDAELAALVAERDHLRAEVERTRAMVPSGRVAGVERERSERDVDLRDGELRDGELRDGELRNGEPRVEEERTMAGTSFGRHSRTDDRRL